MGGPSADGVAPSAVVTMPADVTCLVAITGSSAIAVGMADGRLAIWYGRDQAPAVNLKPHAARVLAVGATADAQHVLSDGTRLITGGEFGEIRVFDTTSGALRHTLRGHRTELQDLAVRPGSALLASAGAEADIRVWDTAGGQEIGFVDSDLSTFALAFSPRDGTLASGGTDRRVTLRDPRTFASVKLFALPAPKMVSTLAWSPDGRLVAVGDLDDATLAKGGIQVVDASILSVGRYAGYGWRSGDPPCIRR